MADDQALAVVILGVDELACKEKGAAEDSATACEDCQGQGPPHTIHRLSKNKTKLATLVLNLVTLDP